MKKYKWVFIIAGVVLLGLMWKYRTHCACAAKKLMGASQPESNLAGV